LEGHCGHRDLRRSSHASSEKEVVSADTAEENCGVPRSILDSKLDSKYGEMVVKNTVSASNSQEVETYLANVPEPARSTLKKMRATIKSVVPPEATEGLSYGMPAFHYKGALVAYAAFKNHCSLFPMQASLIDEMRDELKGYRTSKGTLQFPRETPLPAPLIKKIVKARIFENKLKEQIKRK